MIVEGESLLNDETAVVVFNLVLAAGMGSAVGDHGAGSALGGDAASNTIVAGIVDFVRVSADGLAIGVGLGSTAAQLIAQPKSELCGPSPISVKLN